MSHFRVLFVLTAAALFFGPLATPFITRTNLDENVTPIVGILTQEVSRLMVNSYPDRNITSYIAASYVKFIEGAGARVVPIWIGESREYYKDILSKLNGVIFPGGATYFNQSNGYADAGWHIYEVAMEMNKQGIYMPLWGTCLGFELLTYLAANRTEHREDCASNRQALPLEFKEGYETSRMFRNAPSNIITILKTLPVTGNFHQFCVTERAFSKYGLDKDWSVLSVNHDWNNFEFISTIEHKTYPFYAVMFHSEKNLYEFIQNRSIPHSWEAIISAQYFANFFVNETRKNMNKFPNDSEEAKALIFNYQPEFTGLKGSVFVQQYLFLGRNQSKSGRNFAPYINDKPNEIDVGENDIVLLKDKDELK